MIGGLEVDRRLTEMVVKMLRSLRVSAAKFGFDESILTLHWFDHHRTEGLSSEHSKGNIFLWLLCSSHRGVAGLSSP